MLRSLFQIEIKLAGEPAPREGMRSMFRNLVEETICDFFSTGYCAGTIGIKDSTFLLVESVIIGTVHREVLDETLSWSSNRRTPLDTFIKALIEKIIHDLYFIVPIAANIKERMINVEEEELIRELPVTMEIRYTPIDPHQLWLAPLWMSSTMQGA